MNCREALGSDLHSIQLLLKQSGLPYEDCEDHIKNFIVLDDAGVVIGAGGLELYGELALLRSVVIHPAYQGRSYGQQLYRQLKSKAIDAGVRQLFVLTETADQYFIKRGFQSIPRDAAPERIKHTKQFSGLCPASAMVLLCNI